MRFEGDFYTVVVLSVFRATSVASSAAKYPDEASRLENFAHAAFGAAYTAGSAADDSYATAVAYVAYSAAYAAAGNYYVDDPAEAVADASLAAAAKTAAAFWAALSADATRVDEGTPASALAGAPLWQLSGLENPGGGVPTAIHELWREMKRNLLAAGQDWDVWTDWYDARLAGKRANKTLEIARATLSNEIWDQGPAVVNAYIKDLIKKHKPRPRKKASIAQRSSWDFFLSYSAKDESFAQFVDGTLRGAGYRIFAQFRDMPPGSNFVREMNKGLTGSSRVVALLSSSYVVSDHCQAEWSAAYGADPSGASRKLVPLLIEPCDLDPLAKQIVYKLLVGLSAADAAAAILGAVGHGGPAQSPSEPWPGSTALDAMTSASRDVFDVEPNENYRLKQRTPILGTKTIQSYDLSPRELYTDMQRGIAEFVAHVCNQQQGNFRFSGRLQQQARALLDAAPANFTSCECLNINRAIVGVLRALVLDESEGLLPDHDMISFHKMDLEGYYKLLVDLYPQLKKFRQQNARNRFRLPSARQQKGLDEFLEVAPAKRSVVSPELSKDLRDAKLAIDDAQKFSPTATKEQQEADLLEPHMSAAAQVVPVWNWLANAHEKFVKSGKPTEDTSKAIEAYESLYKELVQVRDYMEWLAGWYY